MSRIAYVNGRYRPHRDAMVHIEDRGFQFADGVYEVCEIRGGHLVDERRHMARLQRSLGELRIDLPMPLSSLSVVLHETARRNRVVDGLIYLQITRGVARRDFGFPALGTKPSVIVTAHNVDRMSNERTAAEGFSVVTVSETRWARVDIKSISLLPNVLAKQAAREQGSQEAWFVDARGFVTEGASSNAWIVTKNRRLVTRPLGHDILRGVTRTVLLDMLNTQGVVLDERPFTVTEVLAASEAFTTSAGVVVMPVVRVNGQPIGEGGPGPITMALRQAFHRYAELS